MRWLALLPFASIVALALAGCAAPADEEEASANEGDALSSSTQRDPVVDQARRDGKIGEQATGYLGAPDADISREIRAHMNDINIKRRALYTELSVSRRVTVQTVAETFACVIFRDRLEVGEKYRTEAGEWLTLSEDEPVEMPTFCQ